MASLSFDLRLDEISPSLARLGTQKLRDQLLMGMGTVMVSMGQRAFDEPQLRPAPWAKRKSPKGKHPLLIKSGDLRQGLHLSKAGSDTVRVGSPARYAATHQLGRDAIPPRPFFPVLQDQLTGHARAEIGDVMTALIGKAV
ncbi:MAG: phage virion morphogenesis protein [Prosthecobacter sp.]|nr:phage virion morphogenesis protein [Prosthecobacter sp.]